MRSETVGRAALAGSAGVACVIAYQFLVQYGRLVMRIEELERRLNVSRDDENLELLPAGALPPDFDLPLLEGGRMTLSQWKGHRVLLIFGDPACESFRAMVPALAPLEADATAGGLPVPLVITTGDRDENACLFDRSGVRVPVLLQEHCEVARLFGIGQTPAAYMVDEQGAVAGPAALGARAVLALAGLAPQGRGDRPSGTPVASGDGLPAGTLAPDFRLPAVAGGEVALRDLRGRRVLLVFWDPECAPCEELAPALEAIHRDMPHPRVVMVSRRGLEANRLQAAALGLTFPVALQTHWEVSRDYGIVAVPIAYLIDEQGVIAAGVAVGTRAIVALARAEAAVATRDTKRGRWWSSGVSPNGKETVQPGTHMRVPLCYYSVHDRGDAKGATPAAHDSRVGQRIGRMVDNEQPI